MVLKGETDGIGWTLIDGKNAGVSGNEWLTEE